MEARATFRGARISRGFVAMVFALLVALAIGGYAVKTLSLPAATSAAHVSQAQTGSIADASLRSQHGGQQTMDGSKALGEPLAASRTVHGGVQLP